LVLALERKKMTPHEELTELLQVYQHMADNLTVIEGYASLESFAQEDFGKIRRAAVELVNGLEDARAATRRLSEALSGPRRGTGELAREG
jgi:hypothetical protein